MTYNGEEQSVAGYDVKISDPLYTEADFTFSETAALAAGTDAGTYAMGLKAGQFENTNRNFKDVTFLVTDGELTIKPLDVIVTITGHTATTPYDGETHEVEGYDVTADSDLYREEYITGPAATKVGGIKADTYPMNLTDDDFTNNNNNFAPTFTVTDGFQKITPIDVTVKVTGAQDTTDYDAGEHTVTGYTAEAIESELYNPDTDLKFIGETEPTASRTDAGTTYMNLTKEQFRNTNSNFANVTIEVDDGYQTIRPIAAKVTITGNNSTLHYDGTAHTVSKYTATTTSTLYNVADIALDGAATATRTEKGTTPMGLTPEKFSNTNGNFYPVTF